MLNSIVKFLSKYEKIFCLIGFAIVPIFLLATMLSQTMSYEDLYHKSHHSNSSLATVIDETYHFLPRIGEIYQRIAVHYMTPQLTFGPDIIFRSITALVSFGIFYFGAMLILGRKLKLKFLDLLIYQGLFFLIMTSTHKGVLFFGFSHANNYTFTCLLSILFAMIFRFNWQYQKAWQIPAVVLLGIAFAMSTEITPIAFLILAIALFLHNILIKKIEITTFLQKYRLQVLATFSIILGLIIFYLGLSNIRTGSSSYALAYDYVSLSQLISSPLPTIKKLISHTLFNLRFLYFYMLPFAMIIATTSLFFTKKIKAESNRVHFLVVAFAVLYIGALSQIRVEPDLYDRFVMPLFLFISISIMVFIKDFLVQKANIIQTKIIYPNLFLLTFALLFSIDILTMSVSYSLAVKDEIKSIQFIERDFPKVIERSDAKYPNNVRSRIFKVEKNTYVGW